MTIISVDFDDTYTRMPETWDRVISLFKAAGCEVYCITARSEHQMSEVYNTIGKVVGRDNCIATSLQSKKDFVAANCDFYVDIWIDDIPEFVVSSNSLVLGRYAHSEEELKHIKYGHRKGSERGEALD